ncbi:MAG: hypothetical protein J0L77_04255 [Alphaproteobacteria bacterium]|jgi:hypothetical protein|nr:hypothetical protein [Alphaproteobacteria bacterium]
MAVSSTSSVSREKLREMLIRSKFYRLAASVFALVGIGLLMVLMSQYIQGDMFSALKDPFILLILVIPFLPAVVLSWLATKAEKKFNDALESLEKSS